MKKPKWIKNIKVLVWDLDGTLTLPSKKIEIIFTYKIFTKLAKHLNTNINEAKKRFFKLLKKLKGATLTLNSFGMDGYRAVVQIQKEIQWQKYGRFSQF